MKEGLIWGRGRRHDRGRVSDTKDLRTSREKWAAKAERGRGEAKGKRDGTSRAEFCNASRMGNRQDFPPANVRNGSASTGGSNWFKTQRGKGPTGRPKIFVRS